MKVISVTLDQVVIQATEGPEEARQIANIAGFDESDISGLVDILTGKKTEFILNSDRSMREANGGYVRVEIETDFIQPYLDKLKSLTGTSEFPESVSLKSLVRATHTHIVESATLVGGKLRAVVVTPTYNFIGKVFKDAAEREEKAREDALYDILNVIAHEEYEREFKAVGSTGTYVKNPNYGKWSRPKVSRAVESEKVWQEIFGIWAENHATEGQKAVLARIARFKGQKEKYPTTRDYNTIHLDDYQTSMTFEEFQKQ